MAFYSILFPQNFTDDFAYKCLNTVLTRLHDKCRLNMNLKNDELFNLLPCHSNRDISELYTTETFRNVDS